MDISKINKSLPDAPEVVERDNLVKKSQADVDVKERDPAVILKELEDKNRLFKKLKRKGLVANEDIKDIQRDLRKTIKELKELIKLLPECEPSS